MSTTRPLFCVLLVAAVGLVAPAQETATPQADLIATLRSADATTFQKAKACQQLAIVGDVKAVESLASLLPDGELSAYALTALQQIQGAEADAALIAAIDDCSGRALAGLVQAIGQRRITAATSTLADLVGTGKTDSASRHAAIRALGQIGGDEARQVLAGIKQKVTSKRDRRVIVDALLQIGPDHSRKSDHQILPERIRSKDEQVFRGSLQMARRLGASASPIIIEHIGDLTPERQALALICLGDLGDPAALKTARRLMDADDPQVALRAVQAITKLGGWSGSVYPVHAMMKPEIASSVARAIAAAELEDFDKIAIEQLDDWAQQKATAPIHIQLAVIEYASARRLAATTESLITVAKEGANAVRANALRASGATVSAEQFPDVLAKLIGGELTGDVELKTSVLQDAAVRLPVDSTTRAISAAIKGADAAQTSLCLKLLGFLGGDKALDIVAAAARSDDDATVDAATEVLGQWLTADVADELFSLTQDLPDGKYQLRAVRGYLRVGRQLDMPADERMRLVQRGYQIAQRDDERLLALEIVRRHGDDAGMNWLVAQLSEAKRASRKVRNSQFTTLGFVAERLSQRMPEDVSAALQKVDFSDAPPAVRDKVASLMIASQ